MQGRELTEVHDESSAQQTARGPGFTSCGIGVKCVFSEIAEILGLPE